MLNCLHNGRSKVFDSHRRDLLGMAHPLGTGTLFEIDSLINLVVHFRNIYMHKHLKVMRLKLLTLLKYKLVV